MKSFKEPMNVYRSEGPQFNLNQLLLAIMISAALSASITLSLLDLF